MKPAEWPAARHQVGDVARARQVPGQRRTTDQQQVVGDLRQLGQLVLEDRPAGDDERALVEAAEA